METAFENIQDPEELKAIIRRQALEVFHLKNIVEWQNAEIELWKARTYGRRSERSEPELFNEAELITDSEATPPKPRPKPKKGASKKAAEEGRLPPHLERQKKEIDLDESEKYCPEGHRLEKIGEEVTEKAQIIPAKIYVEQIVRPKYACRCCGECVKQAKLPESILPKSYAGEGFLAYLIQSKYQDALPIYRLESILKRMDFPLSRATIARWFIKVADRLAPLMTLISDQIKAAPVIAIDETPIKVLKGHNHKKSKTGFMWVATAGPPGRRLILFQYDPSRSAKAASEILAGYGGAIMCDGYRAYEIVAANQCLVQLACWVHARRYFMEAYKLSDKKSVLAKSFIALIGKLYVVEREARHLSDGERRSLRQQRCPAILAEIKKLCDDNITTIPPKMPLGKAMNYLEKEWPKLIRYIEDGVYPIDNNVTERAIRPLALGRKNWLFADTVGGARASATFYSLIETARVNGLEPYDYLRMLFEKIPYASSCDDLIELLPFRN